MKRKILLLFILIMCVSIYASIFINADAISNYDYIQLTSSENNYIDEWQIFEIDEEPIEYLGFYDLSGNYYEYKNACKCDIVLINNDVLGLYLTSNDGISWQITFTIDRNNPNWILGNGSHVEGHTQFYDIRIGWDTSNDEFEETDLYAIDFDFFVDNGLAFEGNTFDTNATVSYKSGFQDGQAASTRYWRNYYADIINNTNYDTAYQAGYNDALAEPNSSKIIDIIKVIFEAPFYIIQKVFNLELFGINIANFIFTLFSIGVCVFVWKLWRGTR